MRYEVIAEPQGENSLLSINWYNDADELIISGQKLVKGDIIAAAAEAEFFAADLKHNFADLFPADEPTPIDMGEEGVM